MNDNNKTEEALRKEVEKLSRKVAELESRVTSREDQLLLEIIKNPRWPFTIWACDKEFKIVLWNHACEEVYEVQKEALKNSLKEE